MKGINPLRHAEESEDHSDDWIALVQRYLIPGMLVLAILIVTAIQFSNSGGIDGSGGSNQSIFYDMGKTIFSLK